MTYTAEEIADVIDRAHDEMLVRGWCQGEAVDVNGHVCVVGALDCATGLITQTGSTGSYLAWADQWQERHATAIKAFASTVHALPSAWNDRDGRKIDEVLDAFRLTAKALRNGEISVP